MRRSAVRDSSPPPGGRLAESGARVARGRPYDPRTRFAAKGGAEDLLAQVWDENADPFTKTVQITVHRLRSKLGDPNVIDTIRGVAYRISR